MRYIQRKIEAFFFLLFPRIIFYYFTERYDRHELGFDRVNETAEIYLLTDIYIQRKKNGCSNYLSKEKIY